MSMKAIIGLVVAIVVVGGGAWYFSSHKGADGQGADTGTVSGDQGSGTYAALLAMGGSKQCDVTVDAAGTSAPSTGTVYISGGEIRSDVSAATQAGTIEAHMIKTGDTVYSWTDAYPQGIKMKVTASAQGGSKSAYDPNAKVSYSCKSWTPDASKFAVPASVTFMDMTAASAGVPSAPAAAPY